MLEKFTAAYLDPKSHAGTARWVALGVLVFDLISRGASLPNVAGLLVLGGLEGAARIINRGPDFPMGSGPKWTGMA